MRHPVSCLLGLGLIISSCAAPPSSSSSPDTDGPIELEAPVAPSPDFHGDSRVGVQCAATLCEGTNRCVIGSPASVVSCAPAATTAATMALCDGGEDCPANNVCVASNLRADRAPATACLAATVPGLTSMTVLCHDATGCGGGHCCPAGSLGGAPIGACQTAACPPCALLPGARCDGADFHGLTLEARQLVSVSLVGANLSGATLHGTQSADLSGSNMLMAVLRDTYLSESDLSHTDLRAANFEGTFLEDVHLVSADLRHVNFKRTIFCDIDLSDARFEGADLTGARWAQNITCPDHRHVQGNWSTRNPCGEFTR